MAQWDDTLQAILNDPQTMGQLFSIAQSISGSSDDTPAPEGEFTPAEEQDTAIESNPLLALGGLGELDPKLLSIGLTLLSSLSQEDNCSTALLQALKPYLSEKHLKHMDRAIQIAKYTRLISTAYQLLKEDGGESHV